jgi:hypothetical protein
MSLDRSSGATCVFCGQPMAPGEPVVGRPPMAGHAACADAALADDRHWDAVAAAGGDAGAPEAVEEQTVQPRGARQRSGCLTVLLVVIPIVLAALLASLLG